MQALLLRTDRPDGFRRCVRDGNGQIIRTLFFRHREPQLLEGADLAAVQDDIGSALTFAQMDKDGNPTSKPVREFVEEAAEIVKPQEEPAPKRRRR